ncbi:MAG: hypothetical protein ACI8ZM_004635 [Crocinitomix sp.]|jgi:hypothetical protein
MNRKIKTVIVSFALMGIGILTTAAISPSNASNKTTESTAVAVMTFKATEIKLGDIPQGIPIDISFEMVNEGTGPLIIEGAKPSCGCTGVQYPESPIKAGESANITAVYNAKSFGSFTKTITITSNASEKTKVLKFSGVVK